MDKEQAIRSKLMKLEATALFAGVSAEIESEHWAYFRDARKQGFAYNMRQNISPYRASLNFTYVFHNISMIVYLEREANVGKIGEDMWMLSFSGIAGKAQSIMVADALQGLKDKGYYIPNGNENLERQMNFSLGLYGDCIMHVDVRFPIDRQALQCFVEVMDCIESHNTRLDPQSLNDDDEDDQLVIMGDWQTWK